MVKIKKDLQVEFEDAVRRVTEAKIEFAPDVKLQFYAYYKRVNGNAYQTDGRKHKNPDNTLVRGFKMNALFQVTEVSIDEAKQKYIDLANTHIPE